MDVHARRSQIVRLHEADQMAANNTIAPMRPAT
jgi:hypothetical protein